MDKPGYSFVQATFAFFIAVGRRPLGALWITVWHLALYLGIAAVTLYLMAPFLGMIFSALAEGREPDESEIIAGLLQFGGAYSLAYLGFLLASLMVQGAWLRLLARDEVASVIPLRLGADEFRLLLVNLAFIAMNLVAWTVVAIIFGVFNAAVFAGFAAGDSGAGAAALGVLVNLALGLAVAIGAIIVMIRFAAAPALSVRLRGIKLGESLGATKGVASWMFVSYLTLVALVFAGGMVVGVAQQIVVLLTAADLIPTLSALENTDDPAVVLQVLQDILLRPSVLIALGVVLVLQLALQIAFEGSWHGVGAYVARRAAGDFPSDAIVTPSASVGAAPSEG